MRSAAILRVLLLMALSGIASCHGMMKHVVLRHSGCEECARTSNVARPGHFCLDHLFDAGDGLLFLDSHENEMTCLSQHLRGGESVETWLIPCGGSNEAKSFDRVGVVGRGGKRYRPKLSRTIEHY
eukprot:749711-Hanusia_phi.AAC.2